MQTDGYTLSLTSERNRNINFSVVAKHSAAMPGTHSSPAAAPRTHTHLRAYQHLSVVKHQQCVGHFSEPERGGKCLKNAPWDMGTQILEALDYPV